MKKYLPLLFLAGLFAIVGVLAWMQANPSEGPVADARSWSVGKPDAPVKLVEFSDFQCPACAAYYPIVEQLVAEYPDTIQFTYRHFPLKTIHPNADPSARAAEAAGVQGKFWEMYRRLFEKQKEWADSRKAKDLFVSYAESIGLNAEQFLADYNSSEVKSEVNGDFQAGKALGINGTPTFYINDAKIQNPRSYEEFKALIESAKTNTNAGN